MNLNDHLIYKVVMLPSCQTLYEEGGLRINDGRT